LLLAGFLILTASLCAQETQTLVENDRLKGELITGLERCTSASGIGLGVSPCTELAITNKSGAAITAWVALVGSNRILGGVVSGESLPGAPSQLISPGATYREAVPGATQGELKAAVFADGSVFGEPTWIERIVQNRREFYQDTIIALQKLTEAKGAGTPREQLQQEFRNLQQQETKHEIASPRPLPKQRLFNLVDNLLERRPEAADEDTLPQDIHRLESMILDYGKQLLDSKPPITDHPVQPGEPLDSPPSP
jgi:hypothetical protein